MVVIEKNGTAGTRKVQFFFAGERGRRVLLAGSFNDWDPEAAEMRYSAEEGNYSLSLELPPGSYEYKFVVDGAWKLDQDNSDFSANDFGTLNSILTVN